MYRSKFPTNPRIEAYLRDGRMISADETTQDMVERVVNALASADALFSADPRAFAEHLGQELDAGRIVFSTPIMTNAGRYTDRPLAACAVPPVDLRGNLARVRTVVDDYHQAGMGTGFNLDEATDPVSTLRYLNEIAVSGARSGAEDRPVGNMAVLSLSHPRAEEFITCKVGADARGEEWKFNISLSVTDEEMRAALHTAGRERDLLVAAAEAAHSCADPGLLFTDRIQDGNPTPHLGQYVSTAPCAEVGLVPGETCQFGYVNLGRFHTGSASQPVDLDALADTVRILVRALDNAIQASLAHYPSPLSTQIMGIKRKIGVGVCGLADLLVSAGAPYDSPEGRRLAQEVLVLVNYTSKVASVELARQRGACQAVLSGRSRYADPGFLHRFAQLQVDSVTTAQWAALADEIATTGQLRNSSTVALPPTGRSAFVVGASTGVEPLFRLSGDSPGDVHPGVMTVLRTVGRSELLDYVGKHGRLPTDASLPEPVRATLATAAEISPEGHLKMAAAVQACVDEAVSKTVNLPGNARAADVHTIYADAWRLGCKGITVYVDGSRRVQPRRLAN